MTYINPEVVYCPREAVERAAAEFGTPFFLYSEERIRENCRRLKEAFGSRFPGFEALYAVKANSNPEVVKIIMNEGFGLDCSSEAEAWLAGKLGASGMYTANYTPMEELKFAKENGLILNLDDASMVPFLSELGEIEKLSFRINPGMGGGNVEGQSMAFAGPDAKYGVPFEKAAEAYAEAKKYGVKHFGIHMMPGSNELGEEYFAEITAKLFEVVAEIFEKTGIKIEFMNIGGGFGVPYRPEVASLNLEKVAEGVRKTFDEQCAKYGLKEPQLMIEPGRYVTADAGWLVGKVQIIKDGYKKFVGLNTSSNDMPRPSIYGAYHYVSVVTEETVEDNDTSLRRSVDLVDSTPLRSRLEIVSVVGQICENNDQFAKDRELPVCKLGDIVVIHNCGGHAYAMAHNYNGKLKSKEVLWATDGSLKQIRRAETVEDLYATVPESAFHFTTT